MLLVSHGLTTSDYGLYSTLVATGGFLASVTFGLLYTPIVSQYRANEVEGREAAYLGTLLGSAAVVAAAVAMVGGAAHLLLHFPAAILAVTVAMGAHALLQEVARARIRIWLYAASDLVQALSFLGLAYLAVTAGASFSAMALLFAASYGLGVLFSGVALLRDHALSFDRQLLGQVLHPGKWLVANTLVENTLFLGARYAMLAFGATAVLGSFSLAIDLAQRFVGFVINATSFLYQPKAFHAFASEGREAFRRVIFRGGAIASGLGGLALAVVAGTALWPPARNLLPPGFELGAFVTVGAAVIVNRLKKLLIDPFAMRDGRTAMLVVTTAFGSVSGISLVWLSLSLGWKGGVPLGYLAGYLVIAAGGGYACRKMF